MSCVAPHLDGAVLTVRAQPGARRNEVRGIEGDRLKVAVTAIAERGKANAALSELLADALGVRRSQISLLSGATASEKRFAISGLSPQQVLDRLAQVANNQ